MKVTNSGWKSPYPGPRPFNREETDLFFGHEDVIEEMTIKLETRPFLTVVGVSGYSKSSLVRAGLIPALEASLLSSAMPSWCFAIMSPGNDPFKRLVSAHVDPAALGEVEVEAANSSPYGETLAAVVGRNRELVVRRLSGPVPENSKPFRTRT